MYGDGIIAVSPTNKYVADDPPGPSFFMPKVKYSPDWKRFEDKMRSDDPEEAIKAGEAFIEERELSLKNDAKARRYEASRKQAWADEKPQWKKEQLRKETDREQKILRELRDGGVLMKGLKPAPGILLIKSVEHSQSTDSGILLPENIEYESNIAEVLRVSDPRLTMVGKEVPPCDEGDQVLVRKGAGLNIKVKGEKCLLIRFDEVLGVLE